MDNMKLYELARAVPDEAKKSIQAGRLKGMTDINPMWRIKKLTEMFGPCGIGWWYEIEDRWTEEDTQTKQAAAFVEIRLYYTDPETGEESHGIPGTGGASFVSQERNGPYMSDECFKMALTDAISVAAKALGVGADVYFAADRSKYSSQTIEEIDKKFHEEPPKLVCEDCSRVIVSYNGANGKPVDVMKHIEATRKRYGKALCIDCVMKKKAEESDDRAAG